MISMTPIYDQLFLERAIDDQEGRGLVEAIHERQRQRLLTREWADAQMEARPRPLASILFPFAVDAGRVRWPEAVARTVRPGSTLWTRPGSGRTWWT